jgi:murein DD-endopeptidase MepM/ murein hydrolase activator NlpD
MTFQEAGLLEPVEPDGPARPPVQVPAPRVRPTETPSGPPIDSTLLRFAAAARARRGSASAAQGFPAEAVGAWRDLALELDRYLARSLPQTPLAELVRARVTIEAELEYDHRRYGPVPDDLRGSLADRLARFERRIAASRSLGRTMFAAPAPRLLHWPIHDASVSSLFGLRRHPLDGLRKMHYGVDLAADPGRVVTAAARGFVVHSGWSPGYGLMVEIRHQGDLTTRYSHLSRVLCAPGDAVEPGQGIGLVGATGKTTGPHLHFEVWRGGRARDPLALLASAPGS